MFLTTEVREHQQGLPSLVLYYSLVGPGIVQLTDGALQSTWQYRGLDLDAASAEALRGLCRQLAQQLNLGSRWLIETNAIRRPAPWYPPTAPDAPPVVQLIDHERRRQLLETDILLETTYYLTVTYLPPGLLQQKTWRWLAGEPRQRTSKEQFRAISEDHLAHFERTTDSLIAGLRAHFELTRLEPVETPDCTDDRQLRFLRECVTGRDEPFRLPLAPVYLNQFFQAEVVTVPPVTVDGRCVQVVALDRYPDGEVPPRVFAALEALPFPYRWSCRMMLFDRDVSKKIHDRNAAAWRGAERSFLTRLLGMKGGKRSADAAEMVADAQLAEKMAERDLYQFGSYNNRVVLLGDSLDQLRERVQKVEEVFRRAGFGPRVERSNSMDAWRGTWPGHAYSDVRMATCHTANFAYTMPLSTPDTGAFVNPSKHMPAGSPPLFLAATDGNTPVRYHQHAGDNGHGFLLGPVRTGKSVYLAFTAAQWMARYPDAQVFIFDRGASLESLVRAAGGLLFHLGRHDSPRLCPLGRLDEPGEQAWCAPWLCRALELNGMFLAPEHRNAISEALAHLALRPHRSLTHLASGLSEQLRAGLQIYTCGSVVSGGLLDGERDGLALERNRLVLFEMADLLEMDERIKKVTLPYLLHRVRQRIDGTRPTLVIVDEAFMALQDPVFSQVLDSFLRDLPKLNGAVLLATHELDDFFRSSLKDVILGQCATQIFLPTPLATGTAAALYGKDLLKLSDEQREQIAAGVPQRDYFVRQRDPAPGAQARPARWRRIELGLCGVALSFLGANNPGDKRYLRDCLDHDPLSGAGAYLRGRGLPEWAAELERLLDGQGERRFTHVA